MKFPKCCFFEVLIKFSQPWRRASFSTVLGSSNIILKLYRAGFLISFFIFEKKWSGGARLNAWGSKMMKNDENPQNPQIS